jgi:hypothetical protein
MKYRLLIHDPNQTIEGNRYDDWLLKATVTDDGTTAWLKTANNKRSEHLDRKARLIYGHGPIFLPLRDSATVVSLKPNEWFHDKDDPRTWSENFKEARRRENFIYDLCDMEADPKLTDEQKREVLRLVEKWELTRSDFQLLDEKPVVWGYEVPRDGETKTWHWKLRQVRNDPEMPLFDVLK